MSDRFTGVVVVEDFHGFQEFYEKGSASIDTLDQRRKWYPNTYLVLKGAGKESQLAKTTPDCKRIVKVDSSLEFFGVRPKNKEQVFLFDMLANENNKVVTVTGKAGTGKSLVVGSYLLDMLMANKIDKLVFSKPMEIVGSSKYFGTVPGDTKEKFDPFLLSFKYLFEKLSEKGGGYFDSMVKKGLIEFMPLELMRGVSFSGTTYVYLDEAQNINDHVIKTLGTRIGEESRLIMSGDYNQVDIKTKDFKSGIITVIESEHFLQSPITSHINLLKIERGPVAELFAKIYDDK